MGEALLQSRSEISAEGGGSGWRDGKPTATLSHDDRGGAERRHKGRAERRRSAARCRRSKRQHGLRARGGGSPFMEQRRSGKLCQRTGASAAKQAQIGKENGRLRKKRENKRRNWRCGAIHTDTLTCEHSSACEVGDIARRGVGIPATISLSPAGQSALAGRTLWRLSTCRASPYRRSAHVGGRAE